MGAADFTSSRLGQNNLATGSWANDNALFLKIWGGEVLSVFLANCMAMDLIKVRSVSQTKQVTFPILGKTTAYFHTPGAVLAPNQISATERTISIDDLLVSPVFIPNIDELKNYYDVRADYARKVGHSLALQYDKRALQVAVLAARAAANITGGDGGTALTNASYDTDGVALAEGLFDAAQALSEKNVDPRDAVCVVRPKHYFLLTRTPDIMNRLWGGDGYYSDGTITKIAGIRIVKSNQLPSSNISATTGEQNTYSGDFSNTIGSVFTKDAVGCAKLLDIAAESDYLVQNQGTLMVSKMAIGMGILQPECALELKKA